VLNSFFKASHGADHLSNVSKVSLGDLTEKCSDGFDNQLTRYSHLGHEPKSM